MKALIPNALKKGLAIAALTLATPLVPALAPAANAYQGDVVRLQNEGFDACRQLGNTGYTAVVRGRTVYGSGGGRYTNGYDGFSVRYCFQGRSQCEAFLDRITHIVHGVSEIRYASCRARG